MIEQVESRDRRSLAGEHRGLVSSGRRWSPCRNSPYAGNARFALITVLALLAACGDAVLPSEQPTPSIGSPRFGPTCGTTCVTLPGPIPGAFSAVLGRGDSATGRDSVLWATSYPTRSTVKLTVTGRLTRKYTMNTMPAWAAYRGANYFSLDGDGEFTSSQCWGHIVTDFKLPNGNPGGWVRACQTSNNYPPADGVQTFSSIGIVSGAGYVKRWSQFQPSVPGYTNCMSGPCVFVTGGSQTITIEPWANNLVLTATPGFDCRRRLRVVRGQRRRPRHLGAGVDVGSRFRRGRLWPDRRYENGNVSSDAVAVQDPCVSHRYDVRSRFCRDGLLADTRTGVEAREGYAETA